MEPITVLEGMLHVSILVSVRHRLGLHQEHLEPHRYSARARRARRDASDLRNPHAQMVVDGNAGVLPSEPRATSTPAPAPPQSQTPSPATTTYASCDAAQRAGEKPLPRTKGKSRRFPNWIVPSAREGDDDGVVREKSRPQAQNCHVRPPAIRNHGISKPILSHIPNDSTSHEPKQR